MSMAEIASYMADLNGRDRLIELNGVALPDGYEDFRFGMTSEFFFNAYGEPAAKAAMVELAEEYYRESDPPPSLLVQESSSRKLREVADIRRVLLTSRTNDPTVGDLRDEFVDVDRSLSFYIKLVNRGKKSFFPSYRKFSCLVDGRAYRTGGCLNCHSQYGDVENNPSAFIRAFVHRCQVLKTFYAVAGFSLLLGTYSSPLTGDAYPLFRRFPGLLYADSGCFSSEMVRRDDAIRDVNWLTGINGAMVRRIGGLDGARAQLSADVVIHPYEGGVVFQAGSKPRIGDFDTKDIPAAYREVNNLLRPLRFDGWTRPYYLRVPESVDTAEATRSWISRFD